MSNVRIKHRIKRDQRHRKKQVAKWQIVINQINHYIAYEWHKHTLID